MGSRSLQNALPIVFVATVTQLGDENVYMIAVLYFSSALLGAHTEAGTAVKAISNTGEKEHAHSVKAWSAERKKLQ